jgi:hypothetical protein
MQNQERTEVRYDLDWRLGSGDMTDTATNDRCGNIGAKYIVDERCEKQLVLLVCR